MAKRNSNNVSGQLRIIGGQWRGRKLNFPAVKDLRPTADRIRETVFNWLQPLLGGARCLDLFAGSGALGFEALSRGAGYVDMVELDVQAFKQLQVNKSLLQANHCELNNLSAVRFLNSQTKPYDVVFLDPPFQADLWSDMADLLVEKRLLANGARIYAEFPANKELPQFPHAWTLLRDKKAGDVRYCLYVFEAGDGL